MSNHRTVDVLTKFWYAPCFVVRRLSIIYPRTKSPALITRLTLIFEQRYANIAAGRMIVKVLEPILELTPLYKP